MQEADPTPLIADPLRQAIAAMRGYAGQVVRTARAWVELDPGEVVYVEGAEDFDRMTKDGVALTVQVREVSANITLANRKVLEAIVHYWQHQRRNPGRTIFFHYLTTADRGRERSTEFGDSTGLDYWDASRKNADLRPLRSFLADKLGRLARSGGKRETRKQRGAREEWNETIAELVDFVRTASNEEFRDRLVQRIAWETAAPERPEVIQDIQDVLVEHGAHVHAAKPAMSEKALAPLILHVWDVACQSGARTLTHADFCRVFAAAVDDVHVPLEELNELRAAAARSEGGGLPPEPASSSWYAQVLRDRYSAAREASAGGRIDEAETEMEMLLESVRRVASADDTERRRFEQGILLSLAQTSIRRGHRSRSVARYSEATGLGPIDGQNRHLAGWILANLGRSEEAVEQLDPSDGSPQWQATLAIALLAVGRLDRFREVIGDERDIDNPDVILALVRHYSAREDVVRAQHFARRLVGLDDGTAESRFRGAEAAFAVFQLTVSSRDAPSINVREWMQILRRVFSDSAEVMKEGVPLLRLLVLRRRIEFYELLLEGDAVGRDFQTLAQTAPDMAAEVAAFGIIAAREVDLMAAREGCRDPVHAAIIHAIYFEEDNTSALRRLRAVEPDARGAEREMLLVLILELAARLGEDTDSLLERVAELSDPISKHIVRAAVLRGAGDVNGAMVALNSGLSAHPGNLRLLRIAYGLARSQGPSVQEVELAQRVYEVFPAPELRLLLAESRARLGDVDGALRETGAVEDEGYRRSKAAFKAAQFALDARRMNDHAAAAKRFFEADRSDRSCLYAGMAALRAMKHGEAERLFRTLLSTGDADLLLTAYGGLAHAIDAQGGGLPAAREQSVEVLLEGYDRLNGPPEIAGALYYRSLGTRYEKKVHERIGRDFGSLEHLPGIVAIPVEEGLDMMRREQEGARLRAELLTAGVLSFQTAIDLGHRRASYIWFAYRGARRLMIIEPPRFPSDREIHLPSGESCPLLLDQTALLMLAETGLVERIFDSTLPLLVSTETYDWAEEEEHALQAQIRPVEHQRLRDLVEAIRQEPGIAYMPATEVDEELLDSLQQTLSWGDSYELACAHREGFQLLDDFVEVEDLPPAERKRVLRSGDLLRALVGSGEISVTNAARAEEARPSSFRRSRGGDVSQGQPILITHGALEAWHECGLLGVLGRLSGGVYVSPLAERHVRDQLAERDAEHQALAAVLRIRKHLVEAVGTGRVQVTGQSPSEMAVGPESHEEDQILDRLAGPVTRLYARAAANRAMIWSDDPAVHLYLDPLGPMISGAPEIGQLAYSLKCAYPDVQIVGTSDVMQWLEDAGVLSKDDRLAILSDLGAHGRALIREPSVYAAAAVSESQDPSEATILGLVEALPSALSKDIVRRFSPMVASALAAALVDVWFREGIALEVRKRSIERLLIALAPWVASSLPHARFMAELTWSSLVAELVQRLDPETEVLLRLILTTTANDPGRFGEFMAGAWKAIDVLDGITTEAPTEVRRLGGILVALLAVAAEGVEIDGRPVLPKEMVRLAADLFGMEGVLRQTITIQGTSEDGEEHQFSLDNDVLENEAAALLNTISEDPPQPAPANAVPVEVHVPSDDGRVQFPFRDSVDVVLILGRLTPAAREFAATSLALYYRKRGFPEIAERIDALTPAMGSSDEHTSQIAHRTLLRTLLGNPRQWAQFDAHRAFSLLREAPLEDLRAMVGQPEPWRSGETLLDRTIRVRGEISTKEQFFEDVRSLWGPFAAARQQWVETAGAQKDSADAGTLAQLVENALGSEFPYDRIVALGLALGLVQVRPELGTTAVDELEINVLGETRSLSYVGTFQELLTAFLALRLATELHPPALHNSSASSEEGDEAPISLEAAAGVVAMADRLAVDVARFAFRATLSVKHDEEARERVADTESGDSIGDLLLIGHRLGAVLLPSFIDQAPERGLSRVVRELEVAHEQSPLSEGRVPLREVFVPEVLGVGDRGVNPYVALLLTFLAELASPPANAKGDAAEPPESPFWWTDSVRETILLLARRTPSAQSQYLENLARTEGVQDRLGSLLTPGVEGLAAHLASLLQDGDGG